MERQLRVAAIHDMSGFGRCALTVVIPVISAMGIQCIPVPTALLSTHTGGFEDFVFRDMTDFIEPCRAHYEALGVSFDAIYSGFLASAAQVKSCLDFFDTFDNALRIVDPVMGDQGERYKTYTDELVSGMTELVKRADIITPNLTEAAILLGEEYPSVMTVEEGCDWVKRLCKMAKAAVIKGIVLENGIQANISYDRETDELGIKKWENIPVFYPGTGDLFASVLTGRILKGDSLSAAVSAATDFARLAIINTIGNNQPTRNGVEFERLLGKLT